MLHALPQALCEARSFEKRPWSFRMAGPRVPNLHMFGNWITIMAIMIGGLVMVGAIILISPLLVALVICVAVAALVIGIFAAMGGGTKEELSQSKRSPTGTGPSESPESGGSPGSGEGRP